MLIDFSLANDCLIITNTIQSNEKDFMANTTAFEENKTNSLPNSISNTIVNNNATNDKRLFSLEQCDRLLNAQFGGSPELFTLKGNKNEFYTFSLDSEQICSLI